MGLGPMRQRQQRVASAGGAAARACGAGPPGAGLAGHWPLALRLAHGLAGMWLGRMASACVRFFNKSFSLFFTIRKSNKLSNNKKTI